MPIKIPSDLPARTALEKENIFVMTEDRARTQDIRPLEIAIVNLMPTKIATETQILRLLGNTPLQVNITLLRTAEHVSKNTPLEHLERFYKTFDEIRDLHFDGMIVTGAPVEHLPFEQVDYWEELMRIMNFASTGHVFSTLYICWAAMAALYHFYGIPKHDLPSKRFGVFECSVLEPTSNLFRGFDDVFYAPHSRHTEVLTKDVLRVPELTVLADSREAGLTTVESRDHTQVFMTGHLEYDRDTLDKEYKRDVAKNLPIEALLSGRQSRCHAGRQLARPRLALLQQLAELLRVPGHTIRIHRTGHRQVSGGFIAIFNTNALWAPIPHPACLDAGSASSAWRRREGRKNFIGISRADSPCTQTPENPQGCTGCRRRLSAL